MANPYNFEIRSSRLGDMVSHVQYTATGSSAAQTLTKGKSIVTSATTSGTGVLTLVLKEAWNEFENFIGTVQQASYANTGACNVVLTANNSGTAATRTLVFQLTNAAGTATSAAANDIVRITLFMNYVKA